MYVGIISGFIGALLATIVANFSDRREIVKETSGSINIENYIVLKGISSNKLVTYFSFITGGFFIRFSLVFLKTEISNSIMIINLGIFFLFIGFFFKNLTNDNKIEYNNYEIVQYLIFRKNPRVIKWSELKRIQYKAIGPLLELKSEDTVIYVDFKFDGISSLLKLISSKDELKDIKSFEELFNILEE